MKVTIEQGVPIPASKRGKWGPVRLRFEQMKPGESMVISPENGEDLFRLRSRIAQAFSKYFRGNNATRIDGGSVRIWKLR